MLAPLWEGLLVLNTRSLLLLPLLALASPAEAQTADFLDAARDAYSAAWNVSPLRLDNPGFVTRPADLAGDYAWKDEPSFKPGETLLIYAEPRAYGYLDAGEKGFEFGVILDLEVLGAGDELLLQQESFDTVSLRSWVQAKEMFLNISLALNGFTPGSYKLRIIARDLASDETADFTLPFTIAN